jgi:MFS family permease
VLENNNALCSNRRLHLDARFRAALFGRVSRLRAAIHAHSNFSALHHQLGDSPFVVGLVLSAFAATSVISRPFIGYWSDRWSEFGVLVFGLAILAASILFCFLPFVGTILVANGLRGIGWGGLNTGGYALLARIAPESRRGEASGYYSGAQSSGTITFPAIALWLLDAAFGGFAVVFAAAIALAGAGVTFIMGRQLSRAGHSARQESPTL